MRRPTFTASARQRLVVQHWRREPGFSAGLECTAHARQQLCSAQTRLQSGQCQCWHTLHSIFSLGSGNHVPGRGVERSNSPSRARKQPKTCRGFDSPMGTNTRTPDDNTPLPWQLVSNLDVSDAFAFQRASSLWTYSASDRQVKGVSTEPTAALALVFASHLEMAFRAIVCAKMSKTTKQEVEAKSAGAVSWPLAWIGRSSRACVVE